MRNGQVSWRRPSVVPGGAALLARPSSAVGGVAPSGAALLALLALLGFQVVCVELGRAALLALLRAALLASSRYECAALVRAAVLAYPVPFLVVLWAFGGDSGSPTAVPQGPMPWAELSTPLPTSFAKMSRLHTPYASTLLGVGRLRSGRFSWRRPGRMSWLRSPSRPVGSLWGPLGGVGVSPEGVALWALPSSNPGGVALGRAALLAFLESAEASVAPNRAALLALPRAVFRLEHPSGRQRQVAHMRRTGFGRVALERAALWALLASVFGGVALRGAALLALVGSSAISVVPGRSALVAPRALGPDH